MKKIFIICLICIILIIALSTITYAYFTSFSKTSGSVKTDMGIVKLSMVNNNGSINIVNVGNYRAFVRVKVEKQEGIDINKVNNENWDWQDDYLYYKKILNSGDTIQMPEISVNSEKFGGRKYKLIYYAEAVNVMYDENGDEYADWSISVN